MADSQVKILREGKKYIYQHKSDVDSVEIDEFNVFQAAAFSINTNEKAFAALSFLQETLEERTTLDEFQLKGVAALCCSVSDMICSTFENSHKEHTVIRAMAGMEV